MKNKFIKKYQSSLIAMIILIILLVLRAVLLRQPEEKLAYIVNRSELVENVKITGTYAASSQTEVLSPSTGILSKLYVSNKDVVKKGDPLFEVESTATEDQKTHAFVSYQQALTALQTAKQTRDTTDSTMWAKQKAVLDAENNLNFMNAQLSAGEDNPATKDPYTQLEIESIKSSVVRAKKEFEGAETQFKQTDLNISSAQALVTSTKSSLDATKSKTIHSPVTGEIANLLKSVGDGIGDQAHNQPVLLVSSLGSPAITAKVSEMDVVRLAEGQEAQIQFDTDKKTSYKGIVKTIATIGTSTLGITTYDVRLELIHPASESIKPGMTAEITVTTFAKKDVLTVPNSAILYQDNQAFVKRSNKQEDLVKVELGYQGLVKTEIINTLPEGLEILAVTK